jgi:hypothetical protein
MHYHLEIVMPPTDDVEAAVTLILAPFDENGNGEDYSARSAFWDYWVIGGRWGGSKLLATLGKDRVDAFYKILADAKITVSGLQFGKQTLEPSSQIDTVDMLWRDAFPDSPVRECPLFDNYKGQYGDIMPLRDCPKDMTCSHIIIAGPRFRGDGVEAAYMLQDSIWNGVTYQDTTWDHKLSSAIAERSKWLESAKPDYAAARIPADDWLVVTVDYHS